MPAITSDFQPFQQVTVISTHFPSFYPYPEISSWRSPKIAKYPQRSLKILGDHRRLPKIAKDNQKSPKLGKSCKDCQILPMIYEDCWRSPKFAEYCQRLPNITKYLWRSPKIAKMTNNCQISPNIAKILCWAARHMFSLQKGWLENSNSRGHKTSILIDKVPFTLHPWIRLIYVLLSDPGYMKLQH